MKRARFASLVGSAGPYSPGSGGEPGEPLVDGDDGGGGGPDADGAVIGGGAADGDVPEFDAGCTDAAVRTRLDAFLTADVARRNTLGQCVAAKALALTAAWSAHTECMSSATFTVCVIDWEGDFEVALPLPVRRLGHELFYAVGLHATVDVTSTHLTAKVHCVSLSLLDDLVIRNKATIETTVGSLLARAPRRCALLTGEQYLYYIEPAVRVHRELLDSALSRDTLFPGKSVSPAFHCMACARAGVEAQEVHSVNFDGCFKALAPHPYAELAPHPYADVPTVFPRDQAGPDQRHGAHVDGYGGQARLGRGRAVLQGNESVHREELARERGNFCGQIQGQDWPNGGELQTRR